MNTIPGPVAPVPPSRRRVLAALLTLPVMPLLAHQITAPDTAAVPTLDGEFVLINGWVVPIRHFRD